MSEAVEIVTVDASNVEKEGFFCYKSKPKTPGYQHKLSWLKERLAEGMRIKILYEGKRSVGFVEYTPAEVAWRVVNAPNYMVIHCLWVVGQGKGKGYGALLLNECLREAEEAHKDGVVMVSTGGVWLADKKLFLKHGFEVVDHAPPAFELLVKRFNAEAPLPAFPTDWEQRAARYGAGLTVLYANQCPYIDDAWGGIVEAAKARGLEVRTIELKSSREVQELSPTAYGIFGIVRDGTLLTYHYLSQKEIDAFFGALPG